MKDPAPAQVIVVNGDSMGWSDGYRGYCRSRGGARRWLRMRCIQQSAFNNQQ
jgi:hypothetical protein